ncbi:MAG: RNHCP domain-containing protein [Clostridia bacterium]|nr:RNHCP domain-containing protein [Clostridia bacterium]
MGKMFTKNDNGFICSVCGANVPPLKYSSRDHCHKCLSSIHIDISPGDRANTCLGVLEPIEVIYKSDKYTIVYKCSKCGELHNNKSAKDDNFEKILEIMRKNSYR